MTAKHSLIIRKAPVVTSEDLHESAVPCVAILACRLVDGGTGDAVVVDTSRPYGISSQAGDTQFHVLRDQLVKIAEASS